jgi:hypothetical protein
VLYVLYAGLPGRTGIAGGIVAGEVLAFAGNSFRCPLTDLAERYGAQSDSAADIYLPKWFAHNMPTIHTPLLVLMTYLLARNLRRSRKPPTGSAAPISAVAVSDVAVGKWLTRIFGGDLDPGSVLLSSGQRSHLQQAECLLRPVPCEGEAGGAPAVLA